MQSKKYDGRMPDEISAYIPSAFKILKPKHIVIYQCKHLGDCVLTLPLLHRLLKELPAHGRITVISQVTAREIFDSVDARVSVLPLPKSLSAWVAAIKRLIGADVMCLPHTSSRALALGSLLGIPCVGSSGLRVLGFLKPRYGIPKCMVPWRHTAEQYLDLCRRLGLSIEHHDKAINLAHLLEPPLSENLRSRLPESYIVIQPGSRWMFKTPSAGFWSNVIALLEAKSYKIVLTGSNQGAEGELVRNLVKNSHAISVAGRTTISDLAHIIKRAEAYLGVDTLATHLASGLGVSGLALYGPTSEKIWGPYGENAKIVAYYLSDFPCRPCHSDGCGGGKVSECLENMLAKDVVEALPSV